MRIRAAHAPCSGHRPVPRIFKILGVVIVWSVTCGAIRKDEFLCEEAHARLTECCPNFPAGEGYCSFSEGCGNTSYPALSPEESNCIRTASCEKLRDETLSKRHEAPPEVGEPTVFVSTKRDNV